MNQQNEYHNQKMIFEWAEFQKGKYPELSLLNGSLNGVKLTIGQAMKAKRGGLKKGYPDLFLPVARGKYHGLFIELKYGNNKPSTEQIYWLSRLEGEGYMAEICYGAKEAIELILAYLNLSKNEA